MKRDYNNQRTDDIYEVLEHYPKPPVIPASAFNAYNALKNSNANLFQKFLVLGYLRLSTFRVFHNRLDEKIESILRKTDNQSSALFGPLVSATLSLVDDPGNIYPIQRTSTLIVGAQLLYKDLLAGKLDPDKINGQILEMGQYPNCFSTSQYINGKYVGIYKSKNTRQITLIVRGRYFVFELDNSNPLESVQKIHSTIEKILALIENENNEILSPGTLTCATNNTQIKIFGELRKIQKNDNHLEIMKNNFLVICLDLDSKPENDFESVRNAHIENPKNRWYHTSLQLIVYGNSKASIICNFSNYIGGNVMARVGAEIHKRAAKLSLDYTLTNNISPLEFKELKWKIKPGFIQKANEEIKQIYDNQNSSFIIKIGRNVFNRSNIKAVPTFVLALQMTADKFIQKNTKITQFVAISKYRCMDLTTSMVTTRENLKFIEKLKSNEFTHEEIIELFNQAINSQIEELRKSRKTMPLLGILQLQVNSTSGWKRFYLQVLYFKLVTLLGVSGYFKKRNREIIISHPTIFEEVSVFGRPGIKIPYVKYFGLHYQIFEKKIVITMMPGTNWKTKNEEFIKELENNLNRILKIFN